MHVCPHEKSVSSLLLGIPGCSNLSHLGLLLRLLPWLVPYSRKLPRILRVCCYLRKFSPLNWGAWSLLAATPVSNPQKFSLRKSYFRQIAKVFSLESFPLNSIPKNIWKEPSQESWHRDSPEPSWCMHVHVCTNLPFLSAVLGSF